MTKTGIPLIMFLLTSVGSALTTEWAQTHANFGGNDHQVRVHDETTDLWQQVGFDIHGEADGDRSGFSVSLSADGNRVAIGARGNNGAAQYAGHVRVYEWNGSGWQQLGSDIDGNGFDSIFGYSVSLSADGMRLAAGGPKAGGNVGYAQVYEWSGSVWQQMGADFNGKTGDTGDQLGVSVSLSADGARLAIGSHQSDDAYVNAGHVSVYAWSGSVWQQVGADIHGEAAGDRAGSSVSLSADGSRLAIGAVYHSGTHANNGYVRVFDWSGSDWQQVGFPIEGEGAYDYSGKVCLGGVGGNRVAIGGQYNDGAGYNNAGHVRVYDWSGSEWQQVGADIDGKGENEQIGHSIAFSADGSRLAIGSPYSYVGGLARVYDWSGSEWRMAGLDFNGNAAEDRFGQSVSLSATGMRLATGAAGPGSYVRLYDWTGDPPTPPTPLPTPPTPLPTATSPASATGDPHLQNIHGERFDLMKPGKHILINIPRGTSADSAMLRVQADALRLGRNCGDLYFHELNVTGSWAEAKQAGGYHYGVSQRDGPSSEWVAVGKVALKVVIAHTERDVQYLNFYVKHLGQTGFAVGGLLGEDDHEDASTPSEPCVKRMSLNKDAQSIFPFFPAASIAVASLA